MLYNLTKKGCTIQFKTFINDVVRSLLKHCTTHCTSKYKLLYNIGQYVQYCTKNCTISISNPFFGCTTFQVVYGVTLEYNLLYKIVQLMHNVVQYCTGCTGCTTFCTIL